MSRREPPTTKLILEIPEGTNLDALLGGLIGAINRHADAIAPPDTSLAEALRRDGGNNNAEVLTAINNLTDLVKENFMGLKEDNEILNERMGRVETAVDLIAADVTALKTEIEQANERANIDLSPLIARAEGIEARLTGIAGPNAGSDTAAPPPVEPPAEG